MHFTLLWGLIFSGIFCGSAGGILLKKAAVEVGQAEGGLAQLQAACTNPRLVGAVVLYVIPLVFWIYLLRFVPISWLQPIFSLTYVITPLLALAFLGEPVPPARWAGIGVIIAGVFLVARS